MRIAAVSRPADLDAARALLRDYFHSWGIETIDDPDLLEELRTIGERYAPPDGWLLVAWVDGAPAGIVALKRFDARSCVMKRMFVRPAYRRRGVARALAIELLFAAERLGYERMVLDTPADNERALALYRSLGFDDIEPYVDPGHDHVHEGWAFLGADVPPPDDEWFARLTWLLETTYLATDDVFAGSGHSGDAARWELTRGIVLEAIDRDGTFLDVGCANGLLMETCARWASDRGLKLEPYGIDISERLAARARERLPQWSERITTANAWTWEPPMRFDFVSTRVEYVPVARRADYLRRLLECVVAPGGRLIVIGLSREPGDGSTDVATLRAWGLPVTGEATRRDANGTVVMRAAWIDA